MCDICPKLAVVEKLIIGFAQWSMLRTLWFCCYMLPMGSIERSHNIQYHIIYADDTQFKKTTTSASISKLALLSDVRALMINSKLKNNDKKFLVLKSSFDILFCFWDITIFRKNMPLKQCVLTTWYFLASWKNGQSFTYCTVIFHWDGRKDIALCVQGNI